MVRAIVYFNLQTEVTLLEVVLHIRFMLATLNPTLNYMAEFKMDGYWLFLSREWPNPVLLTQPKDSNLHLPL